MSSQSFRKPEFRLYLGYPRVVLTRENQAEPVGTAEPDTPGFIPDLRRLAAEIDRERGRLTVVLPETEVFRGQLEPTGDPSAARREAARSLAAARMSVPPSAACVVVGKPGASGSTPVAGVRAGTLAQTRALLAVAALKPAAIVGDGDFPGFAAPPRLDASPPRLPLPVVAPLAAAVFGGGVLAAVAAGFLLWPAQPPAPASTVPAPTRPTSAPLPTDDTAARPSPRAEASPTPKPAIAAKPVALPPARPPAAPVGVPQITDAVLVTRATRNVVLIEPKPGATPRLQLAELTLPSAVVRDAPADPPLHRPVAAVTPPLAAVTGPEALPAPLPRPKPVTAQPAPAAVPSVAAARPLPRPAATVPVVVASLEPAPPAATGSPAADASPLARPADFSAPAPRKAAVKPPAPKVVAKPAKVVVSPTPVVVQRQAAPVPQPVTKRAAPAPKVVVVKPAAPMAARPTAVAAKAPTPSRAPAAASVALASAATTKVGLSRGSVSLIGVFGGESSRHALLRLPNGNIQRVSAGDSVQGIQVAAVGPDTVRLTGRGRDTVLRLPD